VSGITIGRRGEAASDRLTRALTDANARGERHHCADPEVSHLWLSEDDHERALAAKLCVGCPVQMECWSAANARRERWGVWGSVDFTVKPARLGRPPKTETPP
jgi:hypothetical protein